MKDKQPPKQDQQPKPPLEPITDDLIDRIYRELDASKVTDWEASFIKSTREWWVKRRKLSDKQKSRLAELWRKQTR